ncbi:FtsX-like permease family protein [Clostridium sp. HBUAS56017]|uniref:ABC transporter permease n=1 Tax=Clostridium sp. HBUAS56017 TaxID=2571128 RepID=UPI0011787A83|nr:FtsX-like permease family protein [Clostridium sp. HBUAS56017]
MKSYSTLAWKELKAQKVTSILILIAIVLSTVMTTAIGQSLGILRYLRQQQAVQLNGYRYATFHNIDENQINELSKDQRLSWTGSNILLGTTKLKNSGVTISLNEYDKNSINAYPGISKVKSGRLPENACEIALSQNTLELMNFSGGIGDTIHLDLDISLLKDKNATYKYGADFKLCGILENNYLGYSSGLVVGIAGSGTAKEILPEKYQVYSLDFITSNKKDFQRTVLNLADEFHIDKDYIQYNWLYLDSLGINYDSNSDREGKTSGFSFMTVTGFLIGFLVLLAAGLVIYNILKIAVGKRIKEYGCLRAIGADRKQLYYLVVKQICILCGIGIPLGAIIGTLSAKGITKIVTSSFPPDAFMASSVEEVITLIEQNSSSKLLPLLISALITLLFAFLAAIPAARYAGKVSPTVAMAETFVKIKRKNRKKKHIRNFEMFYANLNLKRNTGRSAITIISLVMSITVFIALNAFSNLLDSSKEVQKLHIGDYSLTNETVGFSPSIVAKIGEQRGVASLSTIKFMEYHQNKNRSLDIKIDFQLKQPYETIQVIGVDEERLKKLYPNMTEAENQALKSGIACLIKNPVSMSIEGEVHEATSFKPGDRITVQDCSMDVIGNTEAVSLVGKGYSNGVQVIVYDTIYDKLTGKNEYTELYPILAKDADKDAIEQIFKDICSEIPESSWISFNNTDKQLEESCQQIKMLAWGLIIFIGLIGLLNIINTTYTNIHTRIDEIGMLRAIGMSSSSLYKTFLWEGVYYGIIASIVGSLAGYICAIFVQAATTEKIALVAIPIVSILEVTIISVISCLITTLIPLRKITRMSIVNSIDIVE